MASSQELIRLRPATTRDLHRVTEITTTSLIDDLTYDYMWPKRKQYPEDNFFWWQLKLERHLYDKRSVFLVVEIEGSGPSLSQSQSCDIPSSGARDVTTSAVTTADESQRQSQTPKSTIISYGIWIRMGSNQAARERFAKKNAWMNVLDGEHRTVLYTDLTQDSHSSLALSF